MTLSQIRSHAVAQGQWRGRCRMGLRWGRASRAGTVMMPARSVDQVGEDGLDDGVAAWVMSASVTSSVELVKNR